MISMRWKAQGAATGARPLIPPSTDPSRNPERWPIPPRQVPADFRNSSGGKTKRRVRSSRMNSRRRMIEIYLLVTGARVRIRQRARLETFSWRNLSQIGRFTFHVALNRTSGLIDSLGLYTDLHRYPLTCLTPAYKAPLRR